MITYRWIHGPLASTEEWDSIDMILAARGWTPWNKQTTIVLVAEDEEGIAGFLPVQLFPHVEPLWVRPNKRGTEVAEQLAKKVIEFMHSIEARGWISVASDKNVAEMCERQGMKKVEQPVYMGRTE
jgi:hypothetical protein